MNIFNNQKIITNKQIYKILKLTKFKWLDNTRLTILEKKSDILKTKSLLLYIKFLLYYNDEGIYNKYNDIVMVNLYNLEGGIENERLYGIGVILHELKHRDDIMLKGTTNEKSADNYAVKFLNNNSRAIKDILKLKDEWKIEEF